MNEKTKQAIWFIVRYTILTIIIYYLVSRIRLVGIEPFLNCILHGGC